MMKLTLLLLAAISYRAAAQFGGAIDDSDFVNDPVVPSEIYDFDGLVESEERRNSPSTLKYYCIFRGNWDMDTQPNLFPDPIARFGNPILYSGSEELRPWIQNRPATRGVEVFVETKFSDTFEQQIGLDTENFDTVQGPAFSINNQDKRFNFVHMPALNVDSTYHFISGLAPFDPSPDWFTGFYLFDTIDEIKQVFFSDFTLRLYPWDLGTQEGETYTALPIDLDQPERVKRFTVETVPNGIFLSSNGKSVPHTAELQCQLYSCIAGTSQQDCNRENWPPSNKCDVLKYPGCDQECDPQVDNACRECKPYLGGVNNTFYYDCCASMTEPINGKCDGDSGVSALNVVITAVASIVGLIFLW